jgi:hypothetical protein
MACRLAGVMEILEPASFNASFTLPFYEPTICQFILIAHRPPAA